MPGPSAARKFGDALCRPRADRAAALFLARPGVDRGAPDVTFIAAPPDAAGASGGDLVCPEAGVELVVPLFCYLGE